MPDRRLRLHKLLRGILGTENVYFQPPESIKMQYPAIVYSLEKITSLHANGGVYLSGRRYSVTLIDKNPDSPLIDRIAALPSCRFDRHYKRENLNHYVYQLYY